MVSRLCPVGKSRPSPTLAQVPARVSFASALLGRHLDICARHRILTSGRCSAIAVKELRFVARRLAERLDAAGDIDTDSRRLLAACRLSLCAAHRVDLVVFSSRVGEREGRRGGEGEGDRQRERRERV